ncbi:dol-P-Man:Man(5)GlcNAc(2)-PP-Dol alpha-1,3-mannosyltransferase [Artemisia annua]|uniref:dolichyl-P-Man:Man5GlcNAc2-PP-dolichol alpha-1,3-mannosyltransferase n=1 Tax=Artemisia annua TaxID=35608 RepID=A0A2U1L4M6_ARTAN|nr:dol-P-Man:Man(5)GlcNAc(2)-PP-Dol alpha-1,3-mannosyltransferase [Artemisia annua]
MVEFGLFVDTKIDWDAYMSQVNGFIEGERDYSNMKGDTGPLVYPAGFLYIYTAIQYVTGGEVYPAQIIFGFLYIVNLGIVLFIYVKTDVLPWWALALLSLSKRLHSIFVLRLFNDCFAMTLFHASLVPLLYQKWHLSLIIFSAAVSVKMNVLLYAPPLLLLMLKAMDIIGVISALAGAAVVQIVLGLPFLWSYPIEYLSKAFNLGRVFIHFWSVNFKFVPEPIFVSKEFALILLVAHLGGLVIFAHYRWCKYFCSLPYLLWRTPYPTIVRLLLFAGVEICWNIFPSTVYSSMTLLTIHVIILCGLWMAPPEYPYESDKSQAGKKAK